MPEPVDDDPSPPDAGAVERLRTDILVVVAFDRERDAVVAVAKSRG